MARITRRKKFWMTQGRLETKNPDAYNNKKIGRGKEAEVKHD